MKCKAEAFLTACEATLYPRLRPLGIELWLTIAGHTTVNIEAIWSHHERKLGRGSDALRQLCSMADAFDVALTATVHPLHYGDLEGESENDAARCQVLDDQALSAAELEAWYGRFGFRRVEGADAWNPAIHRTAGHAE